MYYQSILDSAVDKVNMTIIHIKGAKTALAEIARDYKNVSNELSDTILDLQNYEKELGERLSTLSITAKDSRPYIAVDRAWYLVRLYQNKALSKTQAYELSIHTQIKLQDAYLYPDELKEILRSKEIQEELYSLTGFFEYEMY